MSTKDSRPHKQRSYRGKPNVRCLGTKVQAFFIFMKHTNKCLLTRQGASKHEDKARQKEKKSTRGVKGVPSEWLIKKPILTIIVIILGLWLIPFGVRILLQEIEELAKSKGIQWLSLNGSLGNWFAFFGSYCGVIATVVLGILAVRLTIKQDQSKNYSDISDLDLNTFLLYDLWRSYQPSFYGEDLGRRFILTFNIEGLKTYYNIRKMKASWGFMVNDGKEYLCLRELKVKQERTDHLKVTFCFDDFEGCATKDSFNHFFRLSCYEYNMMSSIERQRWLKLQFEIHYADNSCIRYVDCECCLEYAGVEGGHVVLTPVSHEICINSRRG